MDFEKIITFCKFFKTTIDEVNNKFNNKIISFIDILYCCLYMNGTSCSYSLANIIMCANDIIDVSDSSLKKKRSTISYSNFKQISDSLINFIYEDDNDKREIDVIIRLRNNGLLVKNMIKKGQTSMITKINHKNEIIRFRIITYKINNNDYFLGTTIMNKTVAYFKNIYWKRWTVETNFRESKYFLSMDRLLSKNINKLQQDIYSHNSLFIIYSYFKNIMQADTPTNKFNAFNSK